MASPMELKSNLLVEQSTTPYKDLENSNTQKSVCEGKDILQELNSLKQASAGQYVVSSKKRITKKHYAIGAVLSASVALNLYLLFNSGPKALVSLQSFDSSFNTTANSTAVVEPQYELVWDEATQTYITQEVTYEDNETVGEPIATRFDDAITRLNETLYNDLQEHAEKYARFQEHLKQVIDSQVQDLGDISQAVAQAQTQTLDELTGGKVTAIKEHVAALKDANLDQVTGNKLSQIKQLIESIQTPTVQDLSDNIESAVEDHIENQENQDAQYDESYNNYDDSNYNYDESYNNYDDSNYNYDESYNNYDDSQVTYDGEY